MKKISFSKRPTLFIGLMILTAMVLAACQPAATQAPTVESPTESPTMPPSQAEVILSVASDPALGDILVDGKGMTLYMFTKDEPDKSNCAGDCLTAWPPLLAVDNPAVGEGVDASLLGTADLPDGSKIVTYNKMPLYFWQNDAKAGDATGQGVNSVWYVVSPQGEPVGMEPAAMESLIMVANDPKLGEILVDGKGMTLYMFTKDEPNKSNCAGDCLTAWPPLLAVDNPSVGEGLDASLLGTADLPDGSKIVTYNKMPLYFWQNDAKAGDTTGQGVNSVWYVVSPQGEPVGMEPLIMVANDPKLGDILVDGKGMTLYMFTKDEPNKSNCAGDCLTAWPPLLAVDNPSVGEGLDASLLGTADLPDGSKIVTFNKMPLYYWQADTKPGDTTGQDVNKVWYVVSPEGEPIGR